MGLIFNKTVSHFLEIELTSFSPVALCDPNLKKSLFWHLLPLTLQSFLSTLFFWYDVSGSYLVQLSKNTRERQQITIVRSTERRLTTLGVTKAISLTSKPQIVVNLEFSSAQLSSLFSYSIGPLFFQSGRPQTPSIIEETWFPRASIKMKNLG